MWFENELSMSFLERLHELLYLLLGGAIGFGVLWWKDLARRRELDAQRERFAHEVELEKQAILRETRLTANEESAKIKEETLKSFDSRRADLEKLETRVAERETLVNRQLEGLVSEEKDLRTQQVALREQREVLEKKMRNLDILIEQRRSSLEDVGRFSREEAKKELLHEVEQETLKDAASLSRNIIENTKNSAENEARRILSLAIQRYAGEHTSETTTSTIALAGDDIKGRIIGREGRNIRAFENMTGVTVLIDDAPNTVVISGFDPVRREIARESMSRLIQDGRIHPTRIEEVVNKVKEEIDEAILKFGDEAIFKVGLAPMNPEVVRALGRLKFRRSFSQNVLEHSIEVAHIMQLMASEMGIDVTKAKKAGLLHDIGKSINHEIEGAHALVGADFLKRFGECEEVVNGVASHHGETPSEGPLGVLVSAADAISASRPGARSESMSIYLNRLEKLEEIGVSFDGVEKCFAVQAGRELRIIVEPAQINDDEALMLARKISRRIEDELQYPGQIRVTVIRETRCVDYAK